MFILLRMKSIFRFIYYEYSSFASQYSRLNTHAVHVASGVYKIKRWLPIQIHYSLPKSYQLGASAEIKRKDTYFPPKNRNVFFCVCVCIPNEGNVHETAAARSSLSVSSGYPVSIYKRSLPQ